MEVGFQFKKTKKCRQKIIGKETIKNVQWERTKAVRNIYVISITYFILINTLIPSTKAQYLHQNATTSNVAIRRSESSTPRQINHDRSCVVARIKCALRNGCGRALQVRFLL